jgi:hypothetical protein
MWLVHVVGEADLGLVSQARRGASRDEVEAHGVALRGRLTEVAAAVNAGDRRRLEDCLVTGAWKGSERSGTGEPPLPRALAALSRAARSPEPSTTPGGGASGVGDPVRLVLVATRQASSHALDTAVAADVLGSAVGRFPDLLGVPVASVGVALVREFGERHVLDAVGPLLADVVRGRDRGAVSWGSGATSLALASATSLVRAGLPWVFVDVPLTGPARVVDPLLGVEPNPVVALLIRWRMFRALSELSSGDNAPIRLDAAQKDAVQRLARLWERGHQEVTADALRSLVADAVVRRDGTAGFAVRRYVEARYHELRASEPGAVDLLAWARDHGSGRELGKRLAFLRSAETKDLLPPGELDRASAVWLTGTTPIALNELGKNSSHELRAVPPSLAREAAAALDPTGDGDPDALVRTGLPAAPVTPGLTMFATWVVGRHQREGTPTVGAQVFDEQLGPLIRDHLGVSRSVPPTEPVSRRQQRQDPFRHVVDVHVLLLATPESADAADAQQRELERELRGRQTARSGELFAQVHATVVVVPQDLPRSESEQQLEDAVTVQATRAARTSAGSGGLGAMLVVPTGLKGLALPLVRAVRRESARRGIPMFLRELPKEAGAAPGMHLWPVLAEGDLPLLVAAREAVSGLELDVAWRLLSATSLIDSLAVRCRELRNLFVCADGDDPLSRPARVSSPVPDQVERTLGLLGARLRLIQACLADAEQGTPSPPVRTRFLMLAAAIVEATIAAAVPQRRSQNTLSDFRSALTALVPEKDQDSWTQVTRPLLVLDAARNDIPLTHGWQADPDAAVRAAATGMSTTAGFPVVSSRHQDLRHVQLVDVPSLIDAVAKSVAHLFTPAPGSPGILRDLHRELQSSLGIEISKRARTLPPQLQR